MLVAIILSTTAIAWTDVRTNDLFSRNAHRLARILERTGCVGEASMVHGLAYEGASAADEAVESYQQCSNEISYIPLKYACINRMGLVSADSKYPMDAVYWLRLFTHVDASHSVVALPSFDADSLALTLEAVP